MSLWLRVTSGKPFLIGQDLRCWKTMFILQAFSPNTVHDSGLVCFFFFSWAVLVPELELEPTETLSLALILLLSS